MFTLAEKAYLSGAIQMAIASNKRAQNSSKNPAFADIYIQVAKDLQALDLKVQSLAISDAPKHK